MFYYLQTEEDFYPDELYRKIGFKDIYNVYYYVKKIKWYKIKTVAYIEIYKLHSKS